MQAIHDAELENWHNYEVRSLKEIVSLLRQIGEKKQLIRMKIKGEADVCVTSVLKVDTKEGVIILDRSIDPVQNARILRARGATCETYLDKIRILFSVTALQETEFDGGGALVTPIPPAMIRLQRREYYRMPTPVTHPVTALIPLPPALGGGVANLPLSDISCGGIALLDNKRIMNAGIGENFVNCRIELPEVGAVTTTLQVRNTLDLTLLNDKPSRRIGCMFVDISRGNMASVQRYITKLERERNAKLAGLG